MSDDKATLFIHFNVLHNVHAYLPNRFVSPVMRHSCHHHIIPHCIQAICLYSKHLFEQHILFIGTRQELFMQFLVLSQTSEVTWSEQFFHPQIGVVVDSELVMKYMRHNYCLYFFQVYYRLSTYMSTLFRKHLILTHFQCLSDLLFHKFLEYQVCSFLKFSDQFRLVFFTNEDQFQRRTLLKVEKYIQLIFFSHPRHANTSKAW